MGDYELGTGSSDDSPPPYGQEPEKKTGGLLFPALLALAAVAAIGLLALVYLAFRAPAEPETVPTPPPLPTAPPTPTPAPSATPVVLPPLDESDELMRRLVADLSAHPLVERWVARNDLIRTITVVTVNVASGESPRPNLQFLAPKTRFRPRSQGGRLVPDPAGFSGYDPIADAIGSLDAEGVARVYRITEPLFEIAFKDFGLPDVRFRTMLDRALANLLAVPVLDAGVELLPHATTFRYANPRLEQLSPAQKQFLRMGPRNVKIVQSKLREIQAALASPPAGAQAESP
jgi:hypothetical protein